MTNGSFWRAFYYYYYYFSLVSECRRRFLAMTSILHVAYSILKHFDKITFLKCEHHRPWSVCKPTSVICCTAYVYLQLIWACVFQMSKKVTGILWSPSYFCHLDHEGVLHLSLFFFFFFFFLMTSVDMVPYHFCETSTCTSKWFVTKTHLFKYIENFAKLWYFLYFCSKHRLWVLIRTALAKQF